MNTELKARLIAFLGDLDDSQLTGVQALEAERIYGLLTRKPGRQPGYSPAASGGKPAGLKDREEAQAMLAEAGPDGKELVS